MAKRVACVAWLVLQSLILSAADQYEHRKLFLQFTKVMPLPIEVLNHIASFLAFDDRETDEAFVARTYALKNIKKEHKAKISDLKMPWHEVFNKNEALLSYAVDGKKIYRFREATSVGLHGSSRDMKTAHLVAVSLEPDIGEMKPIPDWNAFLGFSLQVACFAVSRDEAQCAQLVLYGKFSQAHYSNPDNIEPFLRYKNLKSGEDSEIPVNKDYSLFQSIAFNKQGTKIIMFATNCSTSEKASICDDGTFYRLFLVNSEDEHAKKSKMTLLGYFQQLVAKYPKN